MDKYSGIYRVDSNLTDNSDYSYYKRINRERVENDENKKDFYSGLHLNKEQNNNEKGKLFLFNPRTDNNLSETVNCTEMNGDYSLSDNRRYSDINDNLVSYTQHCKELAEDNLPLYMVRENRYEFANGVIVYEPAKKRTKSSFSSIVIRLLVSATLFFGVLGISKVDNKYCQNTVEFVKEIITYDLDNKNNKEIGEIKGVTLIKELQEEDNEEQE